MINKSLSDQNFVLSDQDGVLVGHMSFQEKPIYLQHCENFHMYTDDVAQHRSV